MKRSMTLALFLTLALSPTLVAQSSSTPPAEPGTPQTTATPSPQAETPASETVVNTLELPAAAPETPVNVFSNVAAVNGQGVHVNTDSSKFEEYRSVTRGLAGPDLRIYQDAGASSFLVTGSKLAEEDRQLTFFARTPFAKIDAFYDVIPHRIGNNAHSIEVPVSSTAWGISDYVQRSLQTAIENQFATAPSGINYPFLRRIVEPLVNTPYLFDIGYERKRVGLSLNIIPTGPVDTNVSYFQETREGNRSAGTSFGFGNAVETAEPIDYTTRDFGARLEMPFTNGIVRGGLTVDQFLNRYNSYTFDNPFRVTDATDPSAYTAPAAGSIGGASFGRLSLPPDSTQATANLGVVYKMARQSRLTADVSYGQIHSDTTLMPYTTNTAIIVPFDATNPANLPESQFDGKINNTSVNVQFSTHPLSALRLEARYRMYDVDNKSARVDFPGYVRFDAVWEDIARRTVPYGYKNQVAEVMAGFDLASWVSLEGGYRQNKVDHTFRETGTNTEDTFHVAADFRPLSWLVARTSFEWGTRDYNGYDQIAAESASFEEEEQGNITGLRRFDVAKKDSRRIVAMIQASPFEPLTLAANYVRYFDDYSGDAPEQFGLVNWRTQSINLEADYTPSAHWSVFAFANSDVWGGFQVGRQSGATLSTNPADTWTAYNTDKTKTLGAGVNFTFIPNRLDLRVSSQLQSVNGRAQLESIPGGTPDLAFDVPHVDDTKWSQTTAELTYRATDRWDLGVGGWYESYAIKDDQQGNVQVYMPGAFMLDPSDSDFNGTVAFVRAAYHW